MKILTHTLIISFIAVSTAYAEDASNSYHTKSFLQEFVDAYKDDSSSESAARTIAPAPYNSPPFPFAEHIGPVIGVADSPTYYPLMKAILASTQSESLKNSRINIYGWFNPSYNYSTSRDTNVPMSYAVAPNSLQLSQSILRIERGIDTAQTSHSDWGFRFSSLYGMDYRWTTAKGILSNQLLERNQLYGYDPVEMYVQGYIPNVAAGMTLKIGRYISPPDIEAQLAPDNYLMTHSVMFSYDPYTFMGVLSDIKLNKNWTVQLGLHGGSDMALWSNSAQPNGHLMAKWTADSNNDSLWFGLNSIGSGKFKNDHDNLQQAVGVWSHKFSDKVHMMTEGYYLWQYDAAKGGTCNNGPVRSFGGGGGCGPIIAGRSDAFGAVNYFQIQLSPKDYTTIRNDVLYDVQGQRTGYRALYSEHTVGWTHWFSSTLLVRPELRFDHSWFKVNPYDNGTRKNQFTAASDLIIRF